MRKLRAHPSLERPVETMNLLRKILCWNFAIFSVAVYSADYRLITEIVHSQESARHVLLDFLIFAMFSVEGTVFGLAWWTVWREKPWGRRWAIVGSQIQILQFTPLLIGGWKIFWSFERADWIVNAIGVTGLLAFSRPYMLRKSDPSKKQGTAAIPGDGTNTFINREIWIGVIVMVYSTIYFVNEWLRAKGLLRRRFAHRCPYPAGADRDP